MKSAFAPVNAMLYTAGETATLSNGEKVTITTVYTHTIDLNPKYSSTRYCGVGDNGRLHNFGNAWVWENYQTQG